MCHLLESICWEKGRMELVHLHQIRMNKSRTKLFHLKDPITLPTDLKPPFALYQKWKLRIVYKEEIKKIEWIPYIKALPKKILVLDPGPIDYHFKYADRSCFDQLKINHPDFDDYLILKDDLLTDGSYSNIVLKFGNEWLTPSKPLLKGVRREHLLQQGKISEYPLCRDDLFKADEIRLINALLPLEDAIDLKIEHFLFLNKKVNFVP